MASRFCGSVAWLAECPESVTLGAWASAIPLCEWPQDAPLADGGLRPAMVADPLWHGLWAQCGPLANRLARLVGGVAYSPVLSVLMPGHAIPPHTDGQAREWLVRIHVPLTTNKGAWFICRGEWHHLEVGHAYRINTEATHEVINKGLTPRIHLMIDIRQE